MPELSATQPVYSAREPQDCHAVNQSRTYRACEREAKHSRRTKCLWPTKDTNRGNFRTGKGPAWAPAHSANGKVESTDSGMAYCYRDKPQTSSQSDGYTPGRKQFFQGEVDFSIFSRATRRIPLLGRLKGTSATAPLIVSSLFSCRYLVCPVIRTIVIVPFAFSISLGHRVLT